MTIHDSQRARRNPWAHRNPRSAIRLHVPIGTGTVAAITLAGLLACGGGGGGAVGDLDGSPAEVAEVARLARQVTLLRSQATFITRELAQLRPRLGGPCDDPCTHDSDGDGARDCEDPCPCDAANTCTDPCRGDSDGDGARDCEDPCPYDPAPVADRDGDNIPDCQDVCPDDPENECAVPCPLDQDADGLEDCRDPCPWAQGGPEGSTTRACRAPGM